MLRNSDEQNPRLGYIDGPLGAEIFRTGMVFRVSHHKSLSARQQASVKLPHAIKKGVYSLHSSGLELCTISYKQGCVFTGWCILPIYMVATEYSLLDSTLPLQVFSQGCFLGLMVCGSFGALAKKEAPPCLWLSPSSSL